MATWLQVPLCSVKTPPMLTGAGTLMVPPALSVRLPVPLAVMAALMLKLRSAVSVSVRAVVQLTGAATVISPLSVPPLVVVMVASVPPFNVFCSVPASAASTVMSVGSSSHCPALPFDAAAVIFVPGAIFTLAPEVSMRPPSPPLGAEASRVPLTLTVLPSSLITPLTLLALCALITPLLFTTVDSSASLVPVVISTRPPPAVIVPVLAALLPKAPVSTVTFSSLSPAKSSDTLSPAARPTTRAATVPSFLTCGPINTAWSPAAMLPWLMTDPALPSLANTYLPLKKSLSVIFSVDATRPPTLTCDPGAKRMPFGFMRYTLPLAVSVP